MRPRAGSIAETVIRVLADAPERQPWLTMRQIADRAAELGVVIPVAKIAYTLANLEPDGSVEVVRARRPYLFRRGQP